MKSEQLQQEILQLFRQYGLNIDSHSWLYELTVLLLLLVGAIIILKVGRYLLGTKVTQLVLKSKTHWDDELHNHKFFFRCAHLFPAFLLYSLSPVLLNGDSSLLVILQKVAIVYVLFTLVITGSALLNTVEDAYNASRLAKKAPITGFIQVGKLILVVIAGLLTIASLLNKSPLLLLSGLGAITAVLLLVFRDTILGFVAGIQIAANRMVNTGDWIEMPKYGADGDVLEVGLTTVKVQNWDKTISTIPTYALISEPVKNWRGMQESNGRRIKRAIYIDIHSIKHCDQQMLDDFTQIRFIKDYVAKKKQELADYHQKEKIDDKDLVNARRLTNIGTLRAYMEAYLRQHPKLNQDMTLMVRQLKPTELGLPIEIYCFSADKEWVNYEKIQADIFDHLLAMLPVFQLRAYQRISDK